MLNGYIYGHHYSTWKRNGLVIAIVSITLLVVCYFKKSNNVSKNSLSLKKMPVPTHDGSNNVCGERESHLGLQLMEL